MINTKSTQQQLCRIRPTGVSCILPIELEQYLANWVRSLRSEGIPVSNLMVTLQSKNLAEEFGITAERFKASNSWLKGFRHRYGFSSRVKTNQGQIAPNDYLQRLQNFSLQVKQKVKELGVKVTWNADQTPVQYEMIPKKTIDNTCQKTIWVMCREG